MNTRRVLIFVACCLFFQLAFSKEVIENEDAIKMKAKYLFEQRKQRMADVNPPVIPPFDCPKLPNPPPATNVNRLRPGNIKVTMAVGDSISAGFAMKSGHFWDVKTDFVEYRGSVFSIGGDDEMMTIPNFLRNYNPDIVGPSVNVTLPLDAVSFDNHILVPWDPFITHLNGAQSGARIEDVPAQVDYIIGQLNSAAYKTKVNMKTDWKLFTIFIGANNICPSCENRPYSQPDFYEEYLDNILNQIYTNIPRTFVNIVPMFNISQVWTIHATDPYCVLMWDTLCKSECGCLTDNSTVEKRAKMDQTATEFNERIYKVANEWRAKNYPEFTVSVQPFIQDLVIPLDIGVYFVSELDCFHPSLMADQSFAIGLWNNMMTADKQTINPNNLSVVCPTENTYIQ
jgi:hypothetical protein